MIVSHRHRFIFIKTWKTAGTSIEVFLSRHVGRDAIVTPVYPPVDGHEPRNFEIPTGGIISQVGSPDRRVQKFCNHLPAALARERLGAAIWQQYFSFCVERNPWDQVLSNFYFERAFGRAADLDAFIRMGSDRRNHLLYTDPANRSIVVVDEVIYYERLVSDLARVFRRWGVPFVGNLGIRAKSQYRTDRRHYRELLTNEQAKIIARDYAREIEIHNYVY